MVVYKTQCLIKQSFFQKIFRTLPKRNFIIELQNLLAQNENNLLAISPQDVENLRAKYKVREKDFKRERENLLDIYISFCLRDSRLSDAERALLSHLRGLLGVDDEYLSQRITEEGKLIYREKVKCVIADDRLSDSEREELSALRTEFNISDSDGRDIYSDECRMKIQAYVDGIIARRRMSPDEEAALNNMISGLNIDAKFTDDGLQKLRRFWDIENAELPAIDSPINLQKTENLYYSAKVAWYEERTRTVSVSYAGLTKKFEIAKGLAFKVGNIAPSRNTEEYMKLIDSGHVYLTSKRILFVGEKGNKAIPLQKVLFITPFTNGIEIGKDAGKKPFLRCSDPEMMALYLARLLKDFQDVQ